MSCHLLKALTREQNGKIVQTKEIIVEGQLSFVFWLFSNLDILIKIWQFALKSYETFFMSYSGNHIFYQYLLCNFLSFIVFQIYSKLYVNIFYYHEHWYFDVIIWQLRLGNSICFNQISLLIFSQRGVLNEEYIHCSQRTQKVEAITTDWALKMGFNIFWICILIIEGESQNLRLGYISL